MCMRRFRFLHLHESLRAFLEPIVERSSYDRLVETNSGAFANLLKSQALSTSDQSVDKQIYHLIRPDLHTLIKCSLNVSAWWWSFGYEKASIKQKYSLVPSESPEKGSARKLQSTLVAYAHEQGGLAHFCIWSPVLAGCIMPAFSSILSARYTNTNFWWPEIANRIIPDCFNSIWILIYFLLQSFKPAIESEARMWAFIFFGFAFCQAIWM